MSHPRCPECGSPAKKHTEADCEMAQLADLDDNEDFDDDEYEPF